MTKHIIHNYIVLLTGILLVLSLLLPFTIPARNRILSGAPFRPESYHMYGDIDGDLSVTDNDVYCMQTICIMQYNHDAKLDEFLQSLGMTAEQVLQRTDFNQDGVLNNEDIALMLLYLSGENGRSMTFEQYCRTKMG